MKSFDFYFGDNRTIMIGEKTVVGIDLTANANNATGWAFMKSHNTITKVLTTDEEIIQETVKYSPDIISVGSPLSMPAGRCCISDNCECRRFGIVRYCEKTLMRIGKGVYPCLLPSMLGLTERGIRLAKTFRSLGFEVIESYPAATVDILKISRKKKSLNNLICGLMSFGIIGDIQKVSIMHCEVDAITSALVGYFFLNHQYIPLGNEEEGYLIIPRIQSDVLTKRLIIGLAGEISSGKTTLAEYLRCNYGFKYKRYSQIITNMLGYNAPRQVLQEKGLQIFYSSNGQKKLTQRLIAGINDENSYVIDGLRHIDDFTTLIKHFKKDFIMIFIDSTFDNKYKRYSNNYSDLSREEFSKMLNHEVERNIPLLSLMTMYRIDNNKGYVNMFAQMDKILVDIQKEGL